MSGCDGEAGRYNHYYFTCLQESEYHFLCKKHGNQLECSIHYEGRRQCEVRGCYGWAGKYSHSYVL